MRKGFAIKKIVTGGLLLAALLALAGCGGEKKPPEKPAAAAFDLTKAKDGTYTAESASDSYMGRGRLTVVIKAHKIVAAINHSKSYRHVSLPTHQHVRC